MLSRLINIIENPMKSRIATITGTVTGYIPTTLTTLTHEGNDSINTAFQHAVWTFTIIVAITAIISWIQKQYDRWKKTHPEKIKSIYDNIEEED